METNIKVESKRLQSSTVKIASANGTELLMVVNELLRLGMRSIHIEAITGLHDRQIKTLRSKLNTRSPTGTN